MAEGPLPLTDALEYAADVVNVLGELHRDGLAHGDVAPIAIRVTECGAHLLPPNGRAHIASPREDVSAIGAVLSEMFTGSDSAGDRIREAASRLAADCLAPGDASPDLRRLAVQFRVLRVLARLHEERRVPASRQTAPEDGSIASVPEDEGIASVPPAELIAPAPEDESIASVPPDEPIAPAPEGESIASVPPVELIAPAPPAEIIASVPPVEFIASAPEPELIAPVPPEELIASAPEDESIAPASPAEPIASVPEDEAIASVPPTELIAPGPGDEAIAVSPPAQSKLSPSARVDPLLTPQNPDLLRPDEECPRCNGPAYASSPYSLFEQFLSLLRIRFRRCHWCYYRYCYVFGTRLGRED